MSTPTAPGTPVRKGHSRNASADERRVNIPRRRTKGPLELGDPPFSPVSPSVPESAPESPVPATPITAESDQIIANTTPPRDLSFLLNEQNFHPLPPSSHSIASGPSSPQPLSTLLASSHFRAAAITAATTLSSSQTPLPPLEIFRLWYTRLSCLCLINFSHLAAQEIKVFSDLSSTFYRDLPHFWELRVLAVRLQALAFSDWRRQVGVYYELAKECRDGVRRAKVKEEKQVWRKRLSELGVRVACALVEMGDVAAAARHLESLRGEKVEAMLALLYLRVGNVQAARKMAGDDRNLQALILTADAKWAEAVGAWKGIVEEEDSALARNNLAVCLLYTAKLQEGREALEELVDKDQVFPGMIFNLSTLYELCGEKARSLKMELAEKVAGTGREVAGLSFKI